MAEAISELAVIALLVRFRDRVSMGYFITDDANSAATGNWMGARDCIGLQVIGTIRFSMCIGGGVSDKLEEIFAKFLDSLNNSE